MTWSRVCALPSVATVMLMAVAVEGCGGSGGAPAPSDPGATSPGSTSPGSTPDPGGSPPGSQADPVVTTSVGIELVSISAGTFSMGAVPGDASAGSDESPRHAVTLSAYRIAAKEVTAGQWTQVRAWAVAHGYAFDDSEQSGYQPSGDAALNPVVDVSWYDALKWLNALSELEGKTPAYYLDAPHTQVYRTGQADLGAADVLWTASGYRLPTEAEWENAYRAGTSTIYPWGASLDAAHEWWDQSGSHPVGQKLPNAFGLYDMGGNVHEWCWDWWPSPYPSGSVTDPRGAGSGWARVARGGAFVSGLADYVRASFRRGVNPSITGDFDGGFRVAASGP